MNSYYKFLYKKAVDNILLHLESKNYIQLPGMLLTGKVKNDIYDIPELYTSLRDFPLGNNKLLRITVDSVSPTQSKLIIKDENDQVIKSDLISPLVSRKLDVLLVPIINPETFIETNFLIENNF